MPDFRIKRPKTMEDVAEAAVEPLLDAWVESANTAKGRRIFDSATRGQQLLCAYVVYWDDVTNGGHAQYFENYTGNLWREALEAMRAFDIREHQAILKKALSLFPDASPASTSRDRRKQLEKIDTEKLEKLDERFYEAPGSAEKIQKYIADHPDEFFLSKKRV